MQRLVGAKSPIDLSRAVEVPAPACLAGSRWAEVLCAARCSGAAHEPTSSIGCSAIWGSCFPLAVVPRETQFAALPLWEEMGNPHQCHWDGVKIKTCITVCQSPGLVSLVWVNTIPNCGVSVRLSSFTGYNGSYLPGYCLSSIHFV